MILSVLLNTVRRDIIAVMSITIHLEDFQSWPEVFQEIERQQNMRLFEIIQHNPSAVHDREKKKRSILGGQEGRRFSEREKDHHVNPSEVEPRKRSKSTLCTTISEINPDNPDSILHDSRFTDAVRKLSKEEMALLYQDIVKPVDIYSILIRNRKD